MPNRDIIGFLDRYKVKAELTATKRAALHRYTFPASDEAGFILDMDYSIQHQKNMDMQVDIVSDTEIKGYKLTEYWAFDQQISFYAKFSKPLNLFLFLNRYIVIAEVAVFGFLYLFPLPQDTSAYLSQCT